MGLGTAFHLAQKGYDVTILEKGNSVANVSYIVHIYNTSLIFVQIFRNINKSIKKIPRYKFLASI